MSTTINCTGLSFLFDVICNLKEENLQNEQNIEKENYKV